MFNVTHIYLSLCVCIIFKFNIYENFIFGCRYCFGGRIGLLDGIKDAKV